MAAEYEINDPVLRAQMEEIMAENQWEAGPDLLPQIINELEARRQSSLSNVAKKLVFRYFEEIESGAGGDQDANQEELTADDFEGLQAEDHNCKQHVYQLHQPLAQLLGCNRLPFHKALERVRRIIKAERNPDPADPRFALLSDRLANILGTHRVNEEKLWPLLSPALMTAVEPDCHCCANP